MKIKSLLVGMFACAALVACSNNDLVEGDGNQPLEGDAYVAVTISNPANGFGRAAVNSEDNGTNAENKVDNATFVFFDGAGNYITTVAATLDFNENKQKSEAVLVLKNASITPASVVALLNIPEDFDLKKPLLELKKSLAQDGYGTENTFTMSNSVFKNNKGETRVDTPIEAGQIKNNAESAMEDPIQIYVERVLAKVTITDENLKITPTEVTLNEKSVTLEPEIKGWALSGTNRTSYILKNLTTTIDEGWVWGTNRSFWAEDTNYEGITGELIDNFEFSKYLESKVTPQYCLENTLTIDSYKREVAYTHLLVTAQIKIQGETDPLGSFCNYNGQYWTEENLKIELAHGLKNTDSQNITKDDIEFVQAGEMGNKAYMAKAVFKDGVEVTDDTKTTLENKGQFMMYTDGKCYFWIPIKHLGTEGKTGSIGVVRNHVYVLNLKSIAGLGTPIVVPEQPIIPEKPTDDNSYLAAQVNILPWKVVNQDVDLK